MIIPNLKSKTNSNAQLLMNGKMGETKLLFYHSTSSELLENATHEVWSNSYSLDPISKDKKLIKPITS